MSDQQSVVGRLFVCTGSDASTLTISFELDRSSRFEDQAVSTVQNSTVLLDVVNDTLDMVRGIAKPIPTEFSEGIAELIPITSP